MPVQTRTFREIWEALVHMIFGVPLCLAFRKICIWKKGKDPHPQDTIQHLDFTKDPRPLYYKTPPCVFYLKSVCSKAVFGP